MVTRQLPKPAELLELMQFKKPELDGRKRRLDSALTIADLRAVYEAIWGTSLDPANFHRKVTGADGFLEPVGSSTTRDGGRPAQLFRRGSATSVHPPLLRT